MKTDLLDIRNCDCMELMKEFPDKHFDLAIVDPPYGIGCDKLHTGVRFLPEKRWDIAPDCSYFDELIRVSKNRIIWGANNFPIWPSPGFLFWDKRPMPPTYASGELAAVSFKTNCRIFSGKTGNEVPVKDRIHPTQKPVALYKWLLHNYANTEDKILDTHLGSGSIAIACHYMGFNLTASEIDKDYYNSACARIERETAQQELFK